MSSADKMAVFIPLGRQTTTVIIIYEIAFIGLLVSFVVFCARPLFEAFAHKIRSQAEADAVKNSPNSMLETKVAFLEAEVMELKNQLKSIQETNEFALRLTEKSAGATSAQ